MERPIDIHGKIKFCKGCDDWWPTDAFYTERCRTDGLSRRCKACTTERLGRGDSGGKGEVLHLWNMGYRPEAIALRLNTTAHDVRVLLRKNDVNTQEVATTFANNSTPALDDSHILIGEEVSPFATEELIQCET